MLARPYASSNVLHNRSRSNSLEIWLGANDSVPHDRQPQLPVAWASVAMDAEQPAATSRNSSATLRPRPRRHAINEEDSDDATGTSSTSPLREASPIPSRYPSRPSSSRRQPERAQSTRSQSPNVFASQNPSALQQVCGKHHGLRCRVLLPICSVVKPRPPPARQDLRIVPSGIHLHGAPDYRCWVVNGDLLVREKES